MKLIDAAACPYCARVRIVLAEKGLDYETVEIDLRDRPGVGLRPERDRPRADPRRRLRPARVGRDHGVPRGAVPVAGAAPGRPRRAGARRGSRSSASTRCSATTTTRSGAATRTSSTARLEALPVGLSLFSTSRTCRGCCARATGSASSCRRAVDAWVEELSARPSVARELEVVGALRERHRARGAVGAARRGDGRRRPPRRTSTTAASARPATRARGTSRARVNLNVDELAAMSADEVGERARRASRAPRSSSTATAARARRARRRSCSGSASRPGTTPARGTSGRTPSCRSSRSRCESLHGRRPDARDGCGRAVDELLLNRHIRTSPRAGSVGREGGGFGPHPGGGSGRVANRPCRTAGASGHRRTRMPRSADRASLPRAASRAAARPPAPGRRRSSGCCC